MNFVIKWLGGTLGPYILGAVAAVVLALGAWGQIATLRLHHTKADLAAARADLKTAKAALIDPATRKTWQVEAVQRGSDLATCRTNGLTLEAAIASQNASVAALKADSDQRAKMLSDALTGARRAALTASQRADKLVALKPNGADFCARVSDVDRAVLEGLK